jgi:hypothetical protein
MHSLFIRINLLNVENPFCAVCAIKCVNIISSILNKIFFILFCIILSSYCSCNISINGDHSL